MLNKVNKNGRSAENADRPLCSSCGKNMVIGNGKNKYGVKTYKKLCNTCHKKKYNMPTSGKGKILIIYKEYKKNHCEYCGFIALDTCQLDIHHIDSNHSNNSPDNLQTLCANCHRLVTKINGL